MCNQTTMSFLHAKKTEEEDENNWVDRLTMHAIAECSTEKNKVNSMKKKTYDDNE